MSRNVQVVLLCEDRQHEVFVRRFLVKMGWQKRRMKFLMAPPGKGAAEQFVRKRYPVELRSYRSKQEQVGQALIIILDGDKRGVPARLSDLDKECRAQEIKPREKADRVAVFVPTWNIETWFAYLDGQSVTEERKNYPRLALERDCRRHVDALVEMCRKDELRSPAPGSLQAACEEFQARLSS